MVEIFCINPEIGKQAMFEVFLFVLIFVITYWLISNKPKMTNREASKSVPQLNNSNTKERRHNKTKSASEQGIFIMPGFQPLGLLPTSASTRVEHGMLDTEISNNKKINWDSIVDQLSPSVAFSVILSHLIEAQYENANDAMAAIVMASGLSEAEIVDIIAAKLAPDGLAADRIASVCDVLRTNKEAYRKFLQLAGDAYCKAIVEEDRRRIPSTFLDIELLD